MSFRHTHAIVKKGSALLTTALLTLSSLSLPVTAKTVQPAAVPLAPQAGNWCVAGSFQGWNNSSDALNDAGTSGDLMPGDGVFSLDATIPAAGRYEFKAVECGNWSNAFPAQNSWFITSAANQKVKITLDTNDHTADAGNQLLPKKNIVNVLGDTPPASWTAVGDWQGWNNANADTKLADLGRGLYRLEYTIPVAGAYMGKIVSTNDWAQEFTDQGRVNGDGGNINFSTTAANEAIVVLLDTNTGRMAFTKHAAPAAGNWCVAGSFQGWDNASFALNDVGANGDALGGDATFSGQYVVPAAGHYEFKAVECGNWNNAYPSSNAWFVTSVPSQTVRFTFDTANHAADQGLVMLPKANIVNPFDTDAASYTAVGSFQGWNNANADTKMTYVGGSLWYLAYPVASPGTYMGKVVATGAWDAFGADGRGVDAQNINFQTFKSNDVVRFLLNVATGRVAVYAPPSGVAGQDGVVFKDDLYHDTRDVTYRSPFGAVTAGTSVRLRLRAAKGDLTGVNVSVKDQVTGDTGTYPMSVVANSLDNASAYWEATIPTSHPTLLWYRFVARDGAATAYYEDDSTRGGNPWLKGGAGKAADTAGSSPFQLTVYSPDYTTPDWLKNGVMYQIFVDRFRDGNTANDPAAGQFFYNEHTTIYRSNQADWNANICDPRDAGSTCPGVYSQNFYGGDLQGVVDKLDYLHDLGITVLYLNPIFKSPSNHKYDTTDYTQIDPAFGDMTTWDALVQGANTRGMKIILDGVFNHSSSDSIYFDRYGRYTSVGACESASSTYRDWYYFTANAAGVCAGPANYTSWFGFDSLPKLKAGTPAVRDYFINSQNAIGPYWIQHGASGWRFDVGGDIDPGLANAPANDYWETFRARIRAVNPQSAMLIEEWNDESAWLLGNEMDGGMDYRLRKALIGLMRDTNYTDNDSNGDNTIYALTPSQLVGSIMALYEDYPTQAVQAMMNLLDSHDTNRLRYILKEYGDTDLSKTETDKRQMMIAALLYALPGAPTTYYADEVGASAEGIGGDKQDDPYNRLPFPWPDTTGSYNTFDTAMRDYYAGLGAARNAHPAMRTGSVVPLLVDDTANVLVLGRKLGADLGIVAVNRGAAATVNVSIPATFAPDGTGFILADGSAGVSVSGGKLTLELGANSAAYLVRESGNNATPAAPSITASKGNASATLAISGAGAKYRVYRSMLSGGAYSFVAETATSPYTDSGIVNARNWCYVVTAVDAAGNESGYSNEACVLPFAPLNWVVNLQPKVMTHTIGLAPSAEFSAAVLSFGVTDKAGQGENIIGQIGYRLQGTTEWTWMPAQYARDAEDKGLYVPDYVRVMGAMDGVPFDIYTATIRPEVAGVYDVDFRFTPDGGVKEFHHTSISDGEFASLTVASSADTTAPAAPANLRATNWSPLSVSLAWDAVSATDLYAYDVYRDGAMIGRVMAGTTAFDDATVLAGVTYCYTIKAVDTSFNKSAASNQVCQQATQRMVTMKFNVTVPAFTPAGDTVYMPGDTASILGAAWDPGYLALTKVDATHWAITLTVPDGVTFMYKFARGTWDKVEWWGDVVNTNNRSIVAAYGTNGVQNVDLTVENWRDPIVVAASPANGATGVAIGSTLVYTFSRDINASTVTSATMLVTAQASGVSVSGSYTATGSVVSFIPAAPLAANTQYQVRFTTGLHGADNGDAGAQDAPTFTFTTGH